MSVLLEGIEAGIATNLDKFVIALLCYLSSSAMLGIINDSQLPERRASICPILAISSKHKNHSNSPLSLHVQR